MAIVPRKNKNIVFEKSSTEKSSNPATSENIQKQKSSKNFRPTQGKSYDEMTIEVIEILEKQNINIFDKNRRPGMYLRGNGKIREQILLKSISDDNKDLEDFGEDDKQNTVSSLIDFFKK